MRGEGRTGTLVAPTNGGCVELQDGRGFREQQLLNPAWAQIPVVVLSAYRDVLAASTGLRAVESLKKPVDLKDLLRVVREYRPHAA